MFRQVSSKVIVGLTVLATLVNAQSAIIFEEETTVTKKSKVTIIDGGMSVDLGSVQLVRPYKQRSKGSVRVGSTVITADNRSGQVSGMFVEQNKIVVADAYYGNRTWTLDKIAVTKGCIDALCVGDSAVTTDNRNGIIAGYFGDGRIVVNDSYYGYRTWQSHQVGLTFGCTYTHCAGDQVITSDNRSGVVSGFFADGRVVVNDSYYGNRTWAQHNIALTTAVCSNIFVQRVGICRQF